MDKEIIKRIHTCPHCKGKLNDWFRGNFKGKYLNKKLNTFTYRCFCTEECYNDYKKDFVVEIYNDKPIYCIEMDSEKRYMPYFESEYYFTTIEDCKKRMDMKNISVMNMAMYKLLWDMGR